MCAIHPIHFEGCLLEGGHQGRYLRPSGQVGRAAGMPCLALVQLAPIQRHTAGSLHQHIVVQLLLTFYANHYSREMCPENTITVLHMELYSQMAPREATLCSCEIN